MMKTILDLAAEPMITMALLCLPLLVLAAKEEQKKQKMLKEMNESLDIAKEATEHIFAYKQKKLIEYYKTINQGVVSLPEFIEAEKELKRSQKYE